MVIIVIRVVVCTSASMIVDHTGTGLSCGCRIAVPSAGDMLKQVHTAKRSRVPFIKQIIPTISMPLVYSASGDVANIAATFPSAPQSSFIFTHGICLGEIRAEFQ